MKNKQEAFETLEAKLIETVNTVNLESQTEGDHVHVTVTAEGKAPKGSINGSLEHFTFGLVDPNGNYTLHFVCDLPERLGGIETMEVSASKTLSFRKGLYKTIAVKTKTNTLTQQLL